MHVENFRYNEISFEAGLTKQIAFEINHCNIPVIRDKFAAKNIVTDFGDNKIVAWCAAKSLEIIETLNKKYNLKLGLPNQIQINNNLLSNETDFGMCLALPYLFKNTNTIYPETTVFFNSESDWRNIDSIADEQFRTNYNSTDSFISLVLHEFIHAAHFKNLIAKLGTNKYVTGILSICNVKDKCIPLKYCDNIISHLGKYASVNPLEAVACDMTKRICGMLDKVSLLPQSNPLKDSPYDNLSGLEKWHFLFFEGKFEKRMRKYWNGKFD